MPAQIILTMPGGNVVLNRDLTGLDTVNRMAFTQISCIRQLACNWDAASVPLLIAPTDRSTDRGGRRRHPGLNFGRDLDGLHSRRIRGHVRSLSLTPHWLAPALGGVGLAVSLVELFTPGRRDRPHDQCDSWQICGRATGILFIAPGHGPVAGLRKRLRGEARFGIAVRPLLGFGGRSHVQIRSGLAGASANTSAIHLSRISIIRSRGRGRPAPAGGRTDDGRRVSDRRSRSTAHRRPGRPGPGRFPGVDGRRRPAGEARQPDESRATSKASTSGVPSRMHDGSETLGQRRDRR